MSFTNSSGTISDINAVEVNPKRHLLPRRKLRRAHAGEALPLMRQLGNLLVSYIVQYPQNSQSDWSGSQTCLLYSVVTLL